MTPLRAQLTQGVTPDQLALTLAVGAMCAVFPFFGTTTVLTLLVGIALRLNQPILQTVNYLLTAAQLALILVYVRLGEFIWRAEPVPLSVTQIVADFRASPRLFLQRFGWTGVHAFTAWALTTPFLIAAIYFAARPVMRRLATRATAGRLSSIK